MFICLEDKSSLNLKLGLNIKLDKLKHNNVFVNKLMSMMLDLIIYNILFLHEYLLW